MEEKTISKKAAFKELAETYYLSAKQIAKVLRVSIATANRKMKLVKEKNEVKKYQKITLLQLCLFFDLDIDTTFYQL